MIVRKAIDKSLAACTTKRDKPAQCSSVMGIDTYTPSPMNLFCVGLVGLSSSRIFIVDSGSELLDISFPSLDPDLITNNSMDRSLYFWPPITLKFLHRDENGWLSCLGGLSV